MIARSRLPKRVDTFIVVLVNVAEATVEVKNRLGLHLRAASALAQTAAKFASKIMIGTGEDDLVNAKSMTNLMMLGAAQGSKLKAPTRRPRRPAKP